MNQQGLVTRLEAALRAAVEANEALIEFERCNVVATRLAFQPLNKDQVTRWFDHVAGVRAGNLSIDA